MLKTFTKNSEIREKVKHVSLTNYFKKHFIESKSEIDEILNKTNLNGDVGSLPPSWIRLIPKEQVRQKTMEIREAFETFANKDIAKETPLKVRTENLEQRLKNILNIDASVKYLSEGDYGYVFKITTGEKSYALKTFFGHSKDDYEYTLKRGHSSIMEISHGLFAHNLDSSRNNKIFLARIGDITENNAYMLSDFIDDKSYKGKHFLMKRINFIFCIDDQVSNRLGKKLADFGGVKIRNELRNRETRNIAKFISSSLIKNDVEKLKELKATFGSSKNYKIASDVVYKEMVDNFRDILESGLPKKETIKEAFPDKNYLKDLLSRNVYSYEDVLKTFPKNDIIENLKELSSDNNYKRSEKLVREMIENKFSEEELKGINIDNKEISKALSSIISYLARESFYRGKGYIDRIGSIIKEGKFDTSAISSEAIKELKKANLNNSQIENLGIVKPTKKPNLLMQFLSSKFNR